MRVPYSILDRYVDVSDIDPRELVEKLNTHSVEATLDYFGNPDVEKVVVGKILKTEQHPSLKKLLVCEVDIGDQRVVVCTNDKTVREGDKVFLVLPGGRIGDFHIAERDFKGITSQGMFLGLEELVGVPSEGVFKFHDPQVEPGTDVKTLLGLGEPIIELDITPNRGDLLSVKGLAREVSALYGRPLKEEKINITEPFGEEIEIEVLDEGCNRYRGAVIRNVKVGESPLWLQVALWKFGEAVINNVVDITNYLLFTEGNPMHAFDLDKIEGRVRVKPAEGGEKFLALNGKEYTLERGDLVIADDKKVLALAGIIGGSESAVSEGTKNILLETAHFDPFRVRKTAKRLDIRTESSYRFERNVDIENIPHAQEMAIRLIQRLAGGELTQVRDIYPKPYTPRVVNLSYNKYRRYTGSDIEPSKGAEILNRLGIPTEVRLEGDIKRAILEVVSQQLGCEGYRIPSGGEVDAYLLCGEGEIPVLVREGGGEPPKGGKLIIYRFTPEGLEIEVKP